MEHREMNLFDFCKAVVRSIWNVILWLLRRLGDMIRLTYRQWWVVLIVVVVCVAAALYYSRPNNRMYEANAIATLNGVSNEMVRCEFEALGKVNNAFEHQNTAALLSIDANKANRLSHFAAYDVIDLLADSTVDVVDYRQKVSRMDTLSVHMPHMIALQFRTKSPNDLLTVEQAMIDYLNNRPYFQLLFADFQAQAQREAQFHKLQIEKLDSLTSQFYFATMNVPQVQFDAWEKGLIVGNREVSLFLEDIYKEFRTREYAGARFAVCTAPVVLQSHFILDPIAVNHPIRMVAIALLFGWLLGLAIAAIVDKRYQLMEWLKA